MRPIIFFSLLLSSVILFSCNVAGVFDSNSERQNNLDETFSDNILLSVEITGGFAGVYDKLTVEQNGVATFESSLHNAKTWRIQLSPSELASLDSLMTANLFYDLSDEYVDPQVADAFYYSIYYKNNSDSNLVNTDNFAAPAHLSNIIDEVIALIEKIKNNGLDITLELNKSSFQIGDSVKLKLTFQNISNQELTLLFNDGQIYSFSVYTADGAISDRSLIWNWAADKGFTQALWQMTLQPNEIQTFEVTWNGKNNAGNFVTGEFVVQAGLVSTPGGYSNLENLQIRE